MGEIPGRTEDDDYAWIGIHACIRASAAGQASLEDISKVRSIYMCVDLRGSDVRVPKEVLNHPEVRSALNQVGRETVAKHVGVDPRKAGNGRIFSHNLPDCHSLERSPTTGEQKAMIITAIGEASEFRASFLEVGIGPVPSRFTNRDHSSPFTLSVDRQKHRFDVVFIQTDPTHF